MRTRLKIDRGTRKPRSVRLLAFLGALLSPLAAAANGSRVLTPTINSYPSISPNGEQIAFQSNRSGRFEIFVMNVDGSHVAQVTHSPGDNVTPDWAPDGKRIVFAANPSDGKQDVSNLFIVNVDGSERTQLTNDGNDNSHPHWSARMDRIFFNSGRSTPTGDVADVFSMQPDGSDIQQHTHCAAACTFPSLSPDGKYIVYRKTLLSPGLDWQLHPSERNSEIFVADINGGHERNVSRDAAFDGWPRWSPDGQRIAFSSNRAGPASVAQIFVVNRDGSHLRPVSTGPWSHAQPSWSRDGRKLYVYQVDETQGTEFGNIVMMDVAQ